MMSLCGVLLGSCLGAVPGAVDHTFATVHAVLSYGESLTRGESLKMTKYYPVVFDHDVESLVSVILPLIVGARSMGVDEGLIIEPNRRCAKLYFWWRFHRHMIEKVLGVGRGEIFPEIAACAIAWMELERTALEYEDQEDLLCHFLRPMGILHRELVRCQTRREPMDAQFLVHVMEESGCRYNEIISLYGHLAARGPTLGCMASAHHVPLVGAFVGAYEGVEAFPLSIILERVTTWSLTRIVDAGRRLGSLLADIPDSVLLEIDILSLCQLTVRIPPIPPAEKPAVAAPSPCRRLAERIDSESISPFTARRSPPALKNGPFST